MRFSSVPGSRVKGAWLAALIVGAAWAGLSAQARFSADRLRAHVEFLADDLLEGREAGSRGHEIAARYIASQFELLGVAPGGENGGYFQTVPLQEAEITGATPSLVLTTPGGTKTLAHGTKAVLRGAIAGGTVDVDAPLVFVGYGMQDRALAIDDYEGLDVRGRIAVILSGTPKGMDSEIGAHLASAQGRVAAEHGAIGAIFVQTRESARAFPWEQMVRRASEPLTTWVQKDGAPYDSGAGLDVSARVDGETAAELFEGAPSTLTSILDEAEKEGGRPKGFPLRTSAHLTVTTKTRRYSSPAVIGRVEGTDRSLKNEYVVLMAHADHIGMTGDDGDRINNGALDNAAGAAILIEVARALTASQRPKRSILLLANTAEEKGLLGAEFFAHYPTVAADRIVAAVDLDMPMLLYDFTDVVAYGGTHSTLETTFRRAGAAMGVTLSPDPMPEQAVFVRSDHYAMVKVGVPAVMLATGMANGGEAAWGKFLSTTYHRPSDDLKQPIVWAAGAKFAELNYRVVRELADGGKRPQWYAGDYFGNLYAPDAPKAPRAAAGK